MTEPARQGELLFLKLGAASIWFTTALGVLHPFYREVGSAFLGRLGLPEWLMWATCAGELVLAIIIVVSAPKTWLFVAQAGGVTVFTLILAFLEPMLLVHPFGMLSKNYPFLALVTATWLVAREGWTARATWVLRGGMALIWMTEGLFPKLLFQQPKQARDKTDAHKDVQGTGRLEQAHRLSQPGPAERFVLGPGFSVEVVAVIFT